MTDRITYKTKCCPDANGRQPLPGETKHTVKFPREDGGFLVVEMGKKGYDALCEMIQMMSKDDSDDAQEAYRDAIRIAPWTSRDVCPFES